MTSSRESAVAPSPASSTVATAIPVLDLRRAHRHFAAELEARWRRVLEGTAFVLGPEVREFESAFAAFLGVPACAGLGNGTDALIVALRALGLRAGDEVIVPAFSFFATAEAVASLGGVPVFADVEPASLNLDPRDAAARVTARTVGMIPVHLYGEPCDLHGLLALCSRHGLWLVEDAAQAHGARYAGRRVGGFGQLAAWSFYPTKNLGCFGDGGAVTGADGALVERVRRLANHGQTSRYEHAEVGMNSRLDSLQAAVLSCRLARLDEDNARRRQIAASYGRELAGAGDLVLPPAPARGQGADAVFHQYTIRTGRRDVLKEYLHERGVASSVHYPSPLHRQPALAGLPGIAAAELPVATTAAEQVLSLPMFPELTDEEVATVAAAVRDFFG